MRTRTLFLFAAFPVCGASPSLAVEFLHAPVHLTGLAPSETALADMDGDGDLDVVTVDLQDQVSGTVSVSFNDGVGGFAAPDSYPAGAGSAWLAVGDLNLDGSPDVAVSNSQAQDTNAVTVYLNDGDGTLVAPRVLSAPANAQPQGLVIGDWNGDAKPDVAVALLWTGQVKVFWGNGSGNFPSNTLVNTGFSPRDLAAAQVDGDGRLDFVVNSVDGARVFYGTGTGFTAGPYIDNSFFGCDHVLTGDFNEDGHPDFVTTGRVLTLFVNDGTGHGWTLRQSPVGENPSGLASGDFDGDANLDLAVAVYLGGSVSVYYGDGAGNFPVLQDWGVGLAPRDVAVGDLNGDSKPDVVAPSSQLSRTDFQVLLYGGARTFLARRDIGVIGNAHGFAVADFDRDGNQDVVVAVADSNKDNLKLIFGKSDGTMRDALLVEAFGNNSPTNVIAADFNEDGWIDAAASIFSPGNSMRVWLNNGQGALLPSVVYAAGGNPGSLAAGDIHGDGHLDVIVVNSSMNDNTISVFVGVGDGTFLPGFKVPTLLAPSDVAIADFDKDTDLDVLVTHFNAPAILLFDNDGQGGLAPATINLGVTQTTPSVADLDGDTWLDVALSTGVASVLFNDQAGAFSLWRSGTNASGGVGLADFDHDGDVDMVATDLNRSLASVLLNDGSGQFVVDAVVSTGYESGRCTGADFGKDGLPEIVTANVRAGSISFVTNTTWTAPGSANVLRGQLVSGGVQQAKVSDDTYMVVRNERTDPGDWAVMVRFTAQAPTFVPTSITFSLEARVNKTGLVQAIDLFDWTSGGFVQVNQRTATLADQVVSIPLAAPGRFVQPGTRTMRARIKYKESVPQPNIRWAASIDAVAWAVR
jgi:hypothetical protein